MLQIVDSFLFLKSGCFFWIAALLMCEYLAGQEEEGDRGVRDGGNFSSSK